MSLKRVLVPECLPTIKKNIFGYDALIWNTKHKLTEEILDLAELIRRGLPLGNTPNVLDDAVADITVGLLIGAARGFKAGIQEVESMVYNGAWAVILLAAQLGSSVWGE
ncbi:unnamed protein product [Leptidea sinapis]|uniref:Uncharacterized protein n=1 Tax=Leptidea sinapis TaxID=189913 RepID=A0A5E4PU20_9NEOP|nr:unnamed protein product [Leptidea sinapis]